jgi:lipoyl(octanoyl) transferase
MRAAGADLVFVDAGRVDYRTAWDLQKQLADARAAGTGPDTVLLLEHDPVFTAGKRTRPEDRPTDGAEVIDVDRGGRITWHGPGQLVGYPVVALADPIDVVAYVRMLEQVLIATCAALGVVTGRVEGRSGVWLPAGHGLPERKIAAIGVRIARGIAMHGFALNCDPDLTAFDRIVPCGIADAGVTSLTRELGLPVTVAEALPLVRTQLADGLDGRLAITVDRLSRPAEAPGIDWHLDAALR